MSKEDSWFEERQSSWLYRELAACEPDPYHLFPPPKTGFANCQPYSSGMFVYWMSFGIKDCIDGTSNSTWSCST